MGRYEWEVPPLVEHYNVAPAQNVIAVREASGGREATFLKWGLVPRRAKGTVARIACEHIIHPSAQPPLIGNHTLEAATIPAQVASL
jgi:putative SOS response-associated peptidase YedK